MLIAHSPLSLCQQADEWDGVLECSLNKDTLQRVLLYGDRFHPTTSCRRCGCRVNTHTHTHTQLQNSKNSKLLEMWTGVIPHFWKVWISNPQFHSRPLICGFLVVVYISTCQHDQRLLQWCGVCVCSRKALRVSGRDPIVATRTATRS